MGQFREQTHRGNGAKDGRLFTVANDTCGRLVIDGN
jgi:hypothetical protein